MGGKVTAVCCFCQIYSRRRGCSLFLCRDKESHPHVSKTMIRRQIEFETANRAWSFRILDRRRGNLRGMVRDAQPSNQEASWLWGYAIAML